MITVSGAAGLVVRLVPDLSDRRLMPVLHGTAADGTPVEAIALKRGGATIDLASVGAGLRQPSPNIQALSDVGVGGDTVYLLYRDPGAIDLAAARARRAAPLAEALVLSLLRDAALALHGLHASGVTHGHLDLSLWRITATKQVLLALPLPEPVSETLAPATRRSESEWLALAPERLQGTAPAVASDLWSLGYCAYTLLAELPLWDALSGPELRAAISAGRIPDLNRRLQTYQPSTRDIITCCLCPQAQGRYGSAKDLAEDCARALSGGQADRAKATSGRLKALSQAEAEANISRPQLASRSDFFKVADLQAHIAGSNQASTPATKPDPAIARAAFTNLLRMVVVSQDGLRAWIVLGPGAKFPRDLLVRLLQEAGITHGIQDQGISEAGSASDVPRKIILAEGQTPRPGLPGQSVRGQPIAAAAARVQVQVSLDFMSAIAFTPPGEPVASDEIQAALDLAHVSHGVDQQAVERLSSLGSDSGETRIARGQVVQSGRPGAFRVLMELTANGPTQVRRGDCVAEWEPATTGRPGRCVTGQEVPPPLVADRQPAVLAGEGTSLQRQAERILLVADRSGALSRFEDGGVRVLPLSEHFGDVTGELDTDDELVVHGSILSGARVSCGGGLSVSGSLGDAEISVGGDLNVAGGILAGSRAITVAGHLRTSSIIGRSVVANGMELSGEVVKSQLVSTAGLRATRVSDTVITAAEDIQIEQVEGATSLLWAGHHAPNAVRADQAKMLERRLHSERGRMVRERIRFTAEYQDLQYKSYMYQVGGFMREDYLNDMQRRVEAMQVRSSVLAESLDSARNEILVARTDVESASAASDREDAQLTVRQRAGAGVTLRVGQRIERVLRADEIGIALGGPAS